MARSGVRRDYDNAQRTKRIALIAGVAVFVLVWIGAVVWLGRMDSAASPDQASSEVPVETTQQAPAEITEGSNGEEQESSDSDEQSQGSGTQETGQPNDQPSVQEGSVPQGTFDPMEESGRQQDSAQDSKSGSEQSDSPSAEEIDTTRARTASERYIVAAYGYTGSDEEEYLSAIEEAASEEIYNSPGGKQLQDYAKAAPECGMKSTAILEEFEMVGQGEEGLDAVVTFSVEDTDGQTHTFRQEQRLSSSDGLYTVSGVAVEELISDTTPTESCPGSGANQNPEDGSSSNGDQAVTDERQVSSAAGRFVAASYGYTGNSTKEYRAGVEKVAITEELLDSPGGERINDYSEAAGEDGIEAAAKMERFEITGQSGEEIQGVAYFDIGRSYDQGGGLKGETTPYSQELTLKPYEGSYRVSSASPEQEIEERSTEERSTEDNSSEDASSSAGNGRKLTK
ncbi:MAG: hypothetical protein L0G70_00995 [Rubrobacter sp.]|nr:hypothetical protein [Rubrobacter sp.]